MLEAERKVDFPIVIDGDLAVLEEASAVVWNVPRVACFVILGFVLSCGFHAFWCGTHIVNPFVCDWGSCAWDSFGQSSGNDTERDYYETSFDCGVIDWSQRWNGVW